MIATPLKVYNVSQKCYNVVSTLLLKYFYCLQRFINATNSLSAKLQFKSVGVGALLIKGIKANKYICMNRSSGKVYTSVSKYCN